MDHDGGGDTQSYVGDFQEICVNREPLSPETS